LNHLLSQDKWFYPTTAMGSRYWVGIAAVYGGQTIQHPWGFLTRQGGQSSAAMRIQVVGSMISGQASQWPPTVGSLFVNGLSVVYPQNIPWDLAFEMISCKPGWGSSSSGASGGDVNGDGRITTEDLEALLIILLGG
jgi:hypothetical protein